MLKGSNPLGLGANIGGRLIFLYSGIVSDNLSVCDLKKVKLSFGPGLGTSM